MNDDPPPPDRRHGMTCGHCVASVTEELSELRRRHRRRRRPARPARPPTSPSRARARSTRSPSRLPSPRRATPSDEATPRPRSPSGAPEQVRLAITGMTCASCSARIERKLGKVRRASSPRPSTSRPRRRSSPSSAGDRRADRRRGPEDGYSASGSAPAARPRPGMPSGELPGAAPLLAAEVRHAGAPTPAEAARRRRDGGTATRAWTRATRARADRRPRRPVDRARPRGAGRPPRPHPGAGVIRPRLVVAAALTVPVLLLAMVLPSFAAVRGSSWSSPRPSSSGAPGPSTGPPPSTPVTSPRRWTPWCRSACSRPGAAPSSSCSAAGRTSTSRSPPSSRRSCSPAGSLEARAKDSGRTRCGRCSTSAPRTSPCCTSTRVAHHEQVRVPVDQLVVGDQFIVRPGREGRHRRHRARRLERGRRQPGHRRVDAGRRRRRRRRHRRTINTTGRLIVEARRVGADTRLARHPAPRRDARRPARPTCSASPTGSRPSSCPSCWSSRSGRSSPGS